MTIPAFIRTEKQVGLHFCVFVKCLLQFVRFYVMTLNKSVAIAGGSFARFRACFYEAIGKLWPFDQNFLYLSPISRLIVIEKLPFCQICTPPVVISFSSNEVIFGDLTIINFPPEQCYRKIMFSF